MFCVEKVQRKYMHILYLRIKQNFDVSLCTILLCVHNNMNQTCYARLAILVIMDLAFTSTSNCSRYEQHIVGGTIGEPKGSPMRKHVISLPDPARQIPVICFKVISPHIVSSMGRLNIGGIIYQG